MGRFSVVEPEPSPAGRFAAGRFYVAPEEDPAYGPWEPTRSPLIERRRKPDGTYETRRVVAPAAAEPEPRYPDPEAARAAAAAGAPPGLGSVDVADKELPFLKRALYYGPGEALEGVFGESEATEKRLARDKARVADAGFGWVVGAGERASRALDKGLAGVGAGPLSLVPEGTRGELRQAHQTAQDDFLLAHPEGGIGRAIEEAGGTALASMVGPQALLGAGAGGLAGRGAVALGAGRGLATAAGVAGGAAEGAAQNWLDVVDLPPEEQAAQVLAGAGFGALGGAMAGRGVRRQPAPAPDIDPALRELADRSLAIGDDLEENLRAGPGTFTPGPPGRSPALFPELPLPEREFTTDPGRRVPLAGTGAELLGQVGRQQPLQMEPPPPVRDVALPVEELAAPVPEATSPLRPPMSTKGLENVAGLQDDLAGIADQNFDEIYAARGPAAAVSQWHDAPALQAKLGLTPKDYLEVPPGRTFSSDELALGKHYLGAMRKQARDLETKIAAGDVPDLAAAQAEKATRDRDVVRMMAKLQGQGSSEAGRSLRMLQEALDPQGLAETPKERLQLALLKNYGAKNADQAAAIEQKAVATLRRQAARETRQLARAATAEELSAEFGSLLGELDSLTKRPRGAGGGPIPLDPELVGVIGRLAKNRVRAGVVAVEELADQVYMAVRQYAGDTISREQVKASIVEHALAKPRQQSRLELAEAATARQVAKLEERVAAGPKLPGKPEPPAESARLTALRQRAADLRSQIEQDPRHSLVQRYRELLDDETVEMISKLPDPETDNGAALVGFLRQMEKPTFRDFRTTYWINSILSGSKTALRNLTGNVVRLGELTAMRPVGAAVEQGLAKVQGRPPERLVREALPATVGVLRGIPEGLKRFAFVMKEGYDPGRLVAELTEGGGSKFDQPLPLSPFLLSQKKGVRALGTAITLPTRILEATDALFKTVAATSEGYAWATRKAVQEGAADVPGRVAQLLDEMPEEMVAAQQAFAKRATYQDPMSWVGSAASSLRRGIPGSDALARDLRAKGGIGNRGLAALVQGPQTVLGHLVPFIHISDRVVAGVTDYIPGSKPFRLARLVAEKSPEASDLIARQAVGAALGILGISWAADGKLVGQAPKDEKLRNDFYAEGKQPFSLLVGDRWVPMRDLLGPLAGPFVAAAMYQDHVRVGEDPSQAIPAMALGSARYLLDASYMATLQQVIEAVESERGEAGRGLVSAGARVEGGYAPYSGLLRNVAAGTDVGEDGRPRVVERNGFLDELKSGIPGLRQDLPARLGSLDEELTQSTGRAGAFIPFVPTENQVANVGLAEQVERLRYTLTARRTEIRRIEQQIADARTRKDAAAVQELRAQLPKATTAELDGLFKGVRAQEQRIRELRHAGRPGAEQAEVRILTRMKTDLERVLARVGE